MVDSSTSAEIVYKITEPNGCPTCGGDRAIKGHEDVVLPNEEGENPPVCAGCGEVLGENVVEKLD